VSFVFLKKSVAGQEDAHDVLQRQTLETSFAGALEYAPPQGVL